MENRMEQGRRMYELGVRLGQLGTVAIGSAGGSLAQALARAVGCGVAVAGGEARFHDGGCAACAAWLGQHYQFPASLFLRQQGGHITTWLLDHRGRLLEPPERAEHPLSPCAGQWDLLVGVDQGWAAERCAGRRRQGALAAQGPRALILALERLGYVVIPPRPGVPLFQSDPEGFSLQVEVDGRQVRLPGEDALDAAGAWTPAEGQIPALYPRPTLL